MKKFEIDFSDISLFGNSASEDEDNDIFESYAVRRVEVDKFISEMKICIIKTLKGCGKSAILRIAKNELFNKNKIVFSMNFTEITPEYENDDPDIWVKKWKESIYTRIAEEVGGINNIPVDLFRNEIKSVAIEAGMRQINFIDKLKNILSKISINCGNVNIEMTHGNEKNSCINNMIMKGLNDDIFIFIDDIDHNFINTKNVKARLVGFLTACRYIANETPKIKFRLTIRPNSWNIIKREYSAMNSHISQYIIPMYWSHGDIKKILQKRICGYISRKYNEIYSEEEAFDYIFKKVIWDGNETYASQPIATYAKRRPRWAKEIFRLAAEEAKSRGKKYIDLDDINFASNHIGDTIINELSAEFSCEYPDIEQYMRQFYNQKNSFKEDELFTIIKNRILNHIDSHSIGVKYIAHALFYCGFLYARENLPSGRYKNYYFEDKPFLFEKYDTESGKYMWEIDLIFRNVLNIKKR